MKTEIWKSHPYIAGIEVSTLGRVRSLKGCYYAITPGKDGYLRVCFRVNGKVVSKLVHRLVAETFLPNPENSLQVNHKDCDRTNNNVDNLNWCTRQDNIAYRDKLRHTARNNAPKSPVYAINLVTLEVSHFRSQGEASQELGVNKGNINSVIKGKYKQTGGYWFVRDDGHAVDVVKSKLHNIGGTGLKIKQGR